MKELTKDTFADFIKEGNTVVDFWAPWCGPCRLMAPEFEAAAPEAGDVKFAKVNTEDHGELAGEHGIRGIPTVIFYKDGKEVHRFSGARQKDAILEEVKHAFD